MRDPRAMPPAILASMLVHLALLAAVGLSPRAKRGEQATAPPLPDPVEMWAGTTAALPGASARTYDVEVGDPVAENRMPVEAAPPPAARPAVAPPLPAPPSLPMRPPRRGAEVRERGPGHERATAAGAGATTSEGSGRGDFGAEGPGTVRNLGRAFTRAIPPACQADPAWASLPAGSAGAARVVLSINEAGHIAGWTIEGEGAAKHLENLVKRTVALLQSGTFAVKGGSVTAGKQTIEIIAVLSNAAVGEGGAMDSLAWRFEGGRGTASFTQATGRRVEITLRVIRTEVAAAAPPG